ncbi:hypothetical protein ACMXYV_00480 [Neptuniibacter sp. SY11_33]|uniref:hypothetical protein n=1 Tax=Neptuniibacter sp. SY11_33 TaxID=3398215 RepID=UPI0039F50B4D
MGTNIKLDDSNDASKRLAKQYAAINQAFDKLESGGAIFVDDETAKSCMEARKAKIRNRDATAK